MLVPSFIFSTYATVKGHLPSISGTALAWLGVVTANQVQFEYWLRIASMFGALTVSGFTVWSIIRKNRQASA